MTAKRQQFIALKWLIESADEKHDNVRIWDSLSSELLSAYNNEVNCWTEIASVDVLYVLKLCELL